MTNKKATDFIFTTNTALLKMANAIKFQPAKHCSVFYHGSGADSAAEFIRQNPKKKYVRLNEIMKSSELGRNLWSSLVGAYNGTKEDRWQQTAEIWYTLSVRMAETSSGNVYVFGDIDSRSNPNKKISSWESEHQPYYFANTVFEKVEAPILSNNKNVDSIFYNFNKWIC